VAAEERPVAPPTPQPPAAGLADVYFDFDRSDITPAARTALEQNGKWLMGRGNVQVRIEGYCDERGTNEYNSRSASAEPKPSSALVAMGVRRRACQRSVTVRNSRSAETTKSRAGKRTGGLTLRCAEAVSVTGSTNLPAGSRRSAVFAGVLWLSCAALTGCATQAALVDVQTDVEMMRGQVDQISDRLGTIDKTAQERSTTGQRGQVDLVVRLDQIGSDVQTIQGRIEEQAHRASELSKAVDEQAFRLTQLGTKLDALEMRLAEQERKASIAPVPVPGLATPPESPPTGQSAWCPAAHPAAG
jgi:uncharacterized coiled-coil protein SlyX